MNTTILGAMTSEQFYFRLADGTNGHTVLEYFTSMAAKHKLSGALIIMDNHRAHYKDVVLELLLSEGAELLFLPPASSVMNPIETLWAIIKRRWRQALLTADVGAIGQLWMQK